MRSLTTAVAVAVSLSIASVAPQAHAEPSCADECPQLQVAAPPPPPAPAPIVVVSATPTRMRSIPVFITGVFFDVIGAAGVATGAALIAAGDCTDRPSLPCAAADGVVDLVGIGAIAGGSIFLAIGIPLTVVGAKTVPDVDKASVIPRVRASARGGSLEWRF